MHTPSYSFLLHLFGCNTVPSIMEIGALFEYVLPLLTMQAKECTPRHLQN